MNKLDKILKEVYVDDIVKISNQKYKEYNPEYYEARISVRKFAKYLEKKYNRKILTKEYEYIKVIPSKETIIIEPKDIRCLNKIFKIEDINSKDYTLVASLCSQHHFNINLNGSPLAILTKFNNNIDESIYTEICVEIEKMYEKAKQLVFENILTSTYKTDCIWGKYYIKLEKLQNKYFKNTDNLKIINNKLKEKLFKDWNNLDKQFSEESGYKKDIMTYKSDNKFKFC